MIEQFYDYIKFNRGDSWFKMYFSDIIDYIANYYKPDCIITDIDGLCNYISEFANNSDIYELILLFKYIDDDFENNEYIFIGNGLRCWGFNDLYDLSRIFNLKDIVADMICKKQLYNYCYEL